VRLPGVPRRVGPDVAIKFMHAEFISREDVVGRFVAKRRLRQPSVTRTSIEVFDVGVSPQGEPFLVMEYLEGESLAVCSSVWDRSTWVRLCRDGASLAGVASGTPQRDRSPRTSSRTTSSWPTRRVAPVVKT